MKRDRSSLAARALSGGIMKSRPPILLHATAAGAFMFLLQHLALPASLDSSLIWAVAFGAGAAALAYRQVLR